MSPHTSHVALVALREAVVAGEMTAAQAAESVGIPRGTLYGRWRSTGLLETMPIKPSHASRVIIANLIESHPALSDGQLSSELRNRGIRLNRSSVRGHRVALGIPSRDERMAAIDPDWRPALKITDEQLIESRRKIEARESTVRRQAAGLGVAAQTLYNEWRRLGVIAGRPMGLALDSQPKWCRRAPVRSEVAAHMRQYPWMTPSDIADSMTADGHPIKIYRVRRHMQIIRILGLL